MLPSRIEVSGSVTLKHSAFSTQHSANKALRHPERRRSSADGGILRGSGRTLASELRSQEKVIVTPRQIPVSLRLCRHLLGAGSRAAGKSAGLRDDAEHWRSMR